MGDRKSYPSDVTDEQWALLGPFLEAWRAKRVSVAGRTGEHDLREIVNAILYQTRTGCQWAYLPHDLPQKSATYYYFAVWRDDGTDQVIHDLLRCQTREKPGRKRGLAVDALGLIIAVVVTAASVTDNAIGIKLLDRVAEHSPTVTVAWVDAGFKQDVGVHGAVLGIDVEVVKRTDTQPGFVPVKKRWIVEQVYGTLMLHRRLAREYESRPESSVSRTLWASMAGMIRRLTGTTTATWRNT
jgi:transposase